MGVSYERGTPAVNSGGTVRQRVVHLGADKLRGRGDPEHGFRVPRRAERGQPYTL